MSADGENGMETRKYTEIKSKNNTLVQRFMHHTSFIVKMENLIQIIINKYFKAPKVR